jgi:hypothetical protein
MSDDTSSKKFKWDSGETLDQDKAEYVKEVQAVGKRKIKDAPAADPKTRLREREEEISKEKSKPYITKKSDTTDTDIIIDESVSGLHQDVDTEKAKTTITKPNEQFRGMNRFGKSSAKDSNKKNKDPETSDE